jgi:hypothetical protein
MKRRGRDQRLSKPRPYRVRVHNMPPAGYVSNRIWASKTATPNHILILMCMCGHADRITGEFYVSHQRIALLCGYRGRSSVQRYISDLIKWKYLRRIGSVESMKRAPHHNATTRYQIIWNPDQDQDELIARTPVKDRSFAPVPEVVVPEAYSDPPTPVKPARPGYRQRQLVAVSRGPTRPQPVTISTASCDFDIF